MTNPAAQTALGPMVIVAVDQYGPAPLVRDELARRLLPAAARPVVAMARWRPIRDWLIGLSEKRIPGLWAEVLCRKRYIDDQTEQAVRAGMQAVVILGAGMDTRAYRMRALRDVPVYEMDLPSNIIRKRKRVGSHCDNVHFVPVDFETDDLAAGLAARGCPAGVKTLFIWEAVTQYLTESSVRRTFEFLAESAAGSRLLFTYVRRDFLDGRKVYGAPRAYQDFVIKRRLWKFGLEPEQVPDLLDGYGWQMLEDLGSDEYRARYLEPSGRSAAVTDLERAVSARKR